MGKPGSTIGRRVQQADMTRTGSVATDRIRGGKLQRIRLRVLKRDRWLCQSCMAAGRVTIAAEVDHVVPLHLGGSESDDNRQSLCAACHLEKSKGELDSRGGAG